MDFHTLLRRDLQFLCKRNKIPANMTNVAMADALKALETVEGLDEYMNESNSKAPQSPTTVAKQPPKTATRTTRKTTTTRAEPKPPSKLVTSSCHLKSKSLAGEMEQESKTNKVAKTPAVRSTRKASAESSCIIKVQESKKDETLQSVCSTRRSTRLLGKCMDGLSLETKETLDKQEENEDTEQKVSEEKNSPAGSSEEINEEDEVIPGRDLSASMEKEWEKLKNGSDEEVEDVGDIAVLIANTGSNNETDEVIADEKESMNSLVQEDKLEASSEANKTMCEELPEKNGNDEETGDLGDISVLECVNTETNNEKKEPNNVPLASEQQERDEAIQEKDSESEKMNTFGEDKMVGTGSGDSEMEPEKIYVALDDLPVLDYANTETKNDEKEPKNILALEQADQQKTEEPVQENDEDTTMEQTGSDSDAGVDTDGTVSEADSNQAVLGSDIADEEMIVSEPEGSLSLNIEEAEVKTTTPLASESSFAVEAIAVQFPRPNKLTTPSKNLALNVENKDKENNMEMMMMMNVDQGEVKKKKKVEIDEERLKDVSLRQLHKMFKELSIKSSISNRTALQLLPGNDQKAE